MKKYVFDLRKIDKTTIVPIGTDKMGGQPTYLPPYKPNGCFLMEIFNNEGTNWKEGVLCWQFYQLDRMGGQ